MPKPVDDNKKFRFKSPLPKLVNFFKNSRDKWKAKYMAAKYQAKLYSNQVSYWKNRNAELKRRIKKLENELCNSSKKKTL